LERALHDYDRALRLDPGLGVAVLGRGVVHYRQKRYDAALLDLQRAGDLGIDSAVIAYHRALVHLARHERADAVSNLRRVLRRDPKHELAKALLNQLVKER
jgi:tetratricopeptide (TPR) repeat protein